jgi:hypothetical protein
MMPRCQRLAQLSYPFVFFLSLACATSCRSSSEAASSDPASIREAQLRFVKNYVEAVKSKDIMKVEQTLHPKYRACISPQNQPFLDFMFSKHNQPNTNYKVTSIKPADPKQTFGGAFLPADGFPYPVKPTQVIQVDFDPT